MDVPFAVTEAEFLTKYSSGNGSLSIMVMSRNMWWRRGLQAAVLQHHLPAPDTDVLCLARKSTIEPGREQPDAVQPHAVLLSALEHRGQLLWAEGLLGHCAATWSAAGKESRCWWTWSMSPTARWRCCHTRKRPFQSTVPRACRISVLQDTDWLTNRIYPDRLTLDNFRIIHLLTLLPWLLLSFSCIQQLARQAYSGIPRTLVFRSFVAHYSTPHSCRQYRC